MMFGQIRTRRPDERGTTRADTGPGIPGSAPGEPSSNPASAPTRGTATGAVRDTIVVGLPGNPVAVFVCFLMYVFPMLRVLGGAGWREPRRWLVPATFEVATRKPGRREFWRGTLVEDDAGMAVQKFPRDGSGLISGLRAADGLIDVSEDIAAVQRGDLLAFIPFSEFGILG